MVRGAAGGPVAPIGGNMPAFLAFALGLPLLVGGAEFLVRGASAVARAAGISALVVGLTVVAYGTSAPELAVSLGAALAQQPDIAVGNVVGSNIANILLVIGFSALLNTLVVDRAVIRYNLPLTLAVSLLLVWLSRDGTLDRIDGIVLVVGGVLYTVAAIRSSRKATRLLRQQLGEPEPVRIRAAEWIWRGVQIVIGLAALVVGANWLVDGATRFATWLGVSELVIGLTIVAVGTSLPELATSMVAALRGERDLAVGNAIGSNIFNILIVLGVAVIAAPDGMAVGSHVLDFDLPIMVAVVVLAIPIFVLGSDVSRWEGFLFTVYFAAYNIVLYRQAEHGDGGSTRTFVLAVAIPLAIVLLSFAQSWIAGKRGSAGNPIEKR